MAAFFNDSGRSCKSTVRAIGAGVEAIWERLNDRVSEERWRKVQSLYKTMHRGACTFSDYHIWRDDFDARLEANSELDSIRQTDIDVD